MRGCRPIKTTTNCEHLVATRCEIVDQLAGMNCKTYAAACLHCANEATPQNVNVVTIGLAVAARRNAGLDVADLVVRLRAVLNTGPGAELEKLLAWFAQPSTACPCKAHAAQMNRWGVEGCRKNLETITRWLLEAAAARGWPAGKLSRFMARQIILQAIKNAKRNGDD